jgi:hypothetical protein
MLHLALILKLSKECQKVLPYVSFKFLGMLNLYGWVCAQDNYASV